MWVRVADWMIADDEPPLSDVGSILRGVGLRLFAEETSTHPDLPEGIVEVRSAPPGEARYRLVGQVIAPRDVEADFGSGRQHAGVEFVLDTGAERFQVHAHAGARDVAAGSMVEVVGRFELVGSYEWDAFDLEESRADWLVHEVVVADDDGVMLNLTASSND